MSDTDTDSRAYDWSESEWFEANDMPGYTDDAENDSESTYASNGQGDEWGGAHNFRDGKSKAEWVAHQLLRKVAPKLCSTTLFETPDRRLEAHLAVEGIERSPDWDHDPTAMHRTRDEVELSEPQHRIPKTMPAAWGMHDYGQTRRRKRVNDEAGYLSGGASTGVYLPDVSLPTFITVVETYLALKSLSERERNQILKYAYQQKRQANDRDVDILERVVAMVEDPE